MTEPLVREQDTVKKDIEARYRDHVNGLMLVRLRIIFSVGLAVLLSFTSLDRFIYPAHASALIMIRLVVSFCLVLALLVSFIPRIKTHVVWLLNITGTLVAVSFCYMIFMTNGSSSRYYDGVTELLVGTSVANPFYIEHLIACFLIWIGGFDAAMLFGHGQFNLVNFCLANYSMGVIVLLLALMTKLYKDQHYKAFVHQEQLKKSMEDLQKANEQMEQAKEALQKQALELERSNRELEQFASIASHDLQEPLRMVASFCQKLERRYKDRLDQDANEYIYFAVDGAKRMQALVDALLMYARAGKKDVTISAVDLNKVLEVILYDLAIVIKEHDATIKVGHLPVIMANPIQMTQLFQNLISNALKFKSERKPVVEISARKEKKGWEFVVSDNGIGIDEKHFPKLFVIFQRLHERGAYPGTGIGLALCKKITENYNGKIWVASKVGQGTSFYFILNSKEAQS